MTVWPVFRRSWVQIPAEFYCRFIFHSQYHYFMSAYCWSNIKPLNFITSQGGLWLLGLLDDTKVCQDWSFKTKFTPRAHTVYQTCVLSYLCVLVWKRKVCAHGGSLYLWRSMFVNDRGRGRVREVSWRDANKLSPSEYCWYNYISFTYAYSLACLSVVTSLQVMAQILAKVERWSPDGHLHPIQFFQLGSTLSPEQQPTDLLPPIDSWEHL